MRLILFTLAILSFQGCADTRSSDASREFFDQPFIRNSLSRLPKDQGSLYHPFSDFQEINDEEIEMLSMPHDLNWRREVFQNGIFKTSGGYYLRHKSEKYIIVNVFIGFVGLHETLYSDSKPPTALAAYYLTADRKRAYVSFEELLNYSRSIYEQRK